MGGMQTLSVGKMYKDMGNRTLPSGNIMPEIECRRASAREALKPIRSKFFGQTKVSSAEKIKVLNSLLLSRQFCASGCWPSLTVVQRQRIHVYTMAFFRTCLQESHGHMVDGVDTMLTDLQLLRTYDKEALHIR